VSPRIGRSALGDLGDLLQVELVRLLAVQHQFTGGAEPDKVGRDVGLRRKREMVDVVVEQDLLDAMTRAKCSRSSLPLNRARLFVVLMRLRYEQGQQLSR
jgi:hypothetical protein